MTTDQLISVTIYSNDMFHIQCHQAFMIDEMKNVCVCVNHKGL